MTSARDEAVLFSRIVFTFIFLGEDQNLPKGFVDCPKKVGGKFCFSEGRVECFTAFMLCCARISLVSSLSSSENNEKNTVTMERGTDLA